MTVLRLRDLARPRATSAAAALALPALLALGSAACGGDDGPSSAIDAGSADGAPLPPQLTAEDILELLLGVDGDGSGLDSDTVDGVHANELTRAGERTVILPMSSFEFINTGGDDPALPDSGGPYLQSDDFAIPADLVPGTGIKLTFLTYMNSGPCGINLNAGIYVHGTADQVPAVIEEMDGSVVISPAAGSLEITLAMATETLAAAEPGGWVNFAVQRLADEGVDTCLGDLDFRGAKLTYTAR